MFIVNTVICYNLVLVLYGTFSEWKVKGGKEEKERRAPNYQHWNFAEQESRPAPVGPQLQAFIFFYVQSRNTEDSNHDAKQTEL